MFLLAFFGGGKGGGLIVHKTWQNTKGGHVNK